MSQRALFASFFCSIIIASACLVAGCITDQGKAAPATPVIVVPETQVTIVTPSVMLFTKPSHNLTMNENAELHAGNLSLAFSVKDKSRDPIKQTVSIELTVKNVGNVTVAELQNKLSDLYAVDRAGKQYSVPTHVALIGLKPGEIRSGTIEIANVPDLALPGLVFHYRFGNEEASWEIIPETPV
jgi:hypothetical protein